MSKSLESGRRSFTHPNLAHAVLTVLALFLVLVLVVLRQFASATRIVLYTTLACVSFASFVLGQCVDAVENAAPHEPDGPTLHVARDARLGALLTWNVWLIPFCSPSVLSRAAAVRAFCESALADKLAGGDSDGESDDESNGNGDSGRLVVVCLQEAWAFRAGTSWPLLRLLSWCEGLPVLGRVLFRAGATPKDVRGNGSGGTGNSGKHKTRVQEALSANGLPSLLAQLFGAFLGSSLLPWLPGGMWCWDPKDGALVTSSKSGDRSTGVDAAGAAGTRTGKSSWAASGEPGALAPDVTSETAPGPGAAAGPLRFAVGGGGLSVPSYWEQPLCGLDSGLMILSSQVCFGGERDLSYNSSCYLCLAKSYSQFVACTCTGSFPGLSLLRATRHKLPHPRPPKAASAPRVRGLRRPAWRAPRKQGHSLGVLAG